MHKSPVPVLLRLAMILLVVTCTIGSSAAPVNIAPQAQTERTTLNTLIPQPAAVTLGEGEFTFNAGTRIALDQMEIASVGYALAERLEPAFGTGVDVTMLPPAPQNVVILSVVGGERLGSKGYLLTVTPEFVKIEAETPAGVFYGTQTLLQLLPPVIEGESASIPAVTITDQPRFAHRAAMLDVARHFFAVDDVKRVIDLMAGYKLNRLHLHLTDDQGWRIEIQSWPELTAIGGQTAVGGGEGGFYTQADYAEIVAYAAERFIEVIPEIDMPGHTNAALASYAELNCDGVARQPYTGTEVGFSSLCIDKEITYQFVDDVIRELAALTPGKYIHIGGDESHATSEEDYREFIGRVQQIVQAHGKEAIGWEEIAQTPLEDGTVAQHWFSDYAADAVAQGAMVILSPASKIYIDQKYDEQTPLGLTWAGTSDTRDAYEWQPDQLIDGVPEESILGIEAPLWSETIETIEDIEFMMFPRLLGVAELAWSANGGTDWEEYRTRLAAHGPRLDALGVNFYRDPDVAWE
jgi:hexosaminidase